MATRFQANCPDCGTVTLKPSAIAVHPTDGTWRFSCPDCRTYVVRDASREVLAKLAQGGVRAPRPSRRPSGPPLTLDDLIDLHFALASTKWVAAQAAVELQPHGRIGGRQ